MRGAAQHARVAAEGEQGVLHHLCEDEERFLVHRGMHVTAQRQVRRQLHAEHLALQPCEVKVVALCWRKLQRRHPHLLRIRVGVRVRVRVRGQGQGQG